MITGALPQEKKMAEKGIDRETDNPIKRASEERYSGTRTTLLSNGTLKWWNKRKMKSSMYYLRTLRKQLYTQ